MAILYASVRGDDDGRRPASLRADLRMDLPKLDMLRAMPLTGRQVVAAEVLAQRAVAGGHPGGAGRPGGGDGGGSARRVGGLALGRGGLGAGGGAAGAGDGGPVRAERGGGAFPAWLPADGERARGIEALGQRLLTLAGALVVLIGGLVPAAIVASLVGFALYGFLGVWRAPFAGLTAAAGLAMEVVLGVAALGAAFDRMDVSSEGPGAP